MQSWLFWTWSRAFDGTLTVTGLFLWHVRQNITDYTVVFNCLFCSAIVRSLLNSGFSLSAARVIASSLCGREIQVVSGEKCSG